LDRVNDEPSRRSGLLKIGAAERNAYASLFHLAGKA
jgi:hypothetical protein